MEKSFQEETISGSKAVWLWAILGSLAIHCFLMAVALSWKVPLPPKAKRVVPVEPITLTKVRPGPYGGGGGSPAPATQTLPPSPQPVQPTKPKVSPRAKSKPVVKKPVKKPESIELPEQLPPPPALSIPKPALSVKSPAPGGATAGLGRPGGSGTGGSGSGRGGGSGSGSGIGRGPGSGAGSLLQGYLREIRRLLERHKEYPPVAQRMNMQGISVLRFTIAGDGRIKSTHLSRSSGNKLLDKAAQETVSKVGRFPPLPAALGREKLTVEIPLAFRLTD